jgi:alcohol dehydrogenase class IV
LVVTGRDPTRAGPVLTPLREAGIGAHCFPVSGEPELKTVQAGVAAAREKHCDLVISVGGGSAIDTGKAVAAMLANEGDLLDYVEVIGRGASLQKPGAPFIAVPTTAGTGSEVTRNAVLSSPEHRVKVSLRSPFMLPRLALVDPELTYDLPPAITASTGLDALTQLIEPYVCSRTNPMTDALCLEGLGRAARALPAAFAPGHDPAARQDMCVASLFGGLALANAGLGAVHGFAGPIGGMFPAPHGAICAALLPYVMEANLRALRQRAPEAETVARYRTVARVLTGKDGVEPEAGVTWVQNLVGKMKIPKLSVYGVHSAAVDELVEKSARASSMKANPIALTPEELADVLQRAL